MNLKEDKSNQWASFRPILKIISDPKIQLLKLFVNLLKGTLKTWAKLLMFINTLEAVTNRKISKTPLILDPLTVAQLFRTLTYLALKTLN
jgi:hypothetical protein